MVFVNRTEVNGWYEVANIYTAERGWMHKSTIFLLLTNNKNNCVSKSSNSSYTTTTTTTVECNKAKYLDSYSDEGFDKVVVTNVTASIFFNDLSRKLETVRKGAELRLVSRNPSNFFFLVYNEESDTFGRINCAAVQPYFSRTEQKDGFTATPTYSNSPPVVKIINKTDRTITLWIDDARYTILPGNEKQITVTSGVHTYVATAPNVRANVGEKKWENGYIYQWTWIIVQRRR